MSSFVRSYEDSITELAHSLDRQHAREKQMSDSLKVDGTPRKRTQGFNVDDNKADSSSPPKRETYTTGGMPSTRRMSTDGGMPRASPPTAASSASANGIDSATASMAAMSISVPQQDGPAGGAAHGGGEKKATTRAERRAVQEAQRAAKAARLAAEGKQPPKPKGEGKAAAVASKSASGDLLANGAAGKADKENKAAAAAAAGDKKAGAASKPSTVVPPTLQFDDAKVKRNMEKTGIIHRTTVQKQVALFSHLPQYEREASFSADIKHSKAAIHPAVLQLALRSQSNEAPIVGANARCVGMLLAFKEVIRDYRVPPDQDISRALEVYLRPQITYLTQFRPMSMAQGNAVRALKKNIAELSARDPPLSDEEARASLMDWIDRFIRDRFHFADELITGYGVSKINDGDVILTYANSSIVRKVLIEAHRANKRFRVIIVDSRPLFEGKSLLESLLSEGIDCTYVLLNAVSYVMREVNKVFVGAHGIFSNGTLLSRVGTAGVAMTAHLHSVPVMVCCETVKFSDRVQLDSFVFNELRDPDDLVAIGDNRPNPPLSDWRDAPSLKLLNLAYDVTPAHYITMVITEVGMIPCTSIPVVLREYEP